VRTIFEKQESYHLGVCHGCKEVRQLRIKYIIQIGENETTYYFHSSNCLGEWLRRRRLT